MKEIYNDEINLLKKKYLRLLDETQSTTFVIISNDNSINQYYKDIFDEISLINSNLNYIFFDIFSSPLKNIVNIFNNSKIITIFHLNLKNNTCNDPVVKEKILSILEEVISMQQTNVNNALIFSSMLPTLPPIKSEITTLAEMELNAILKNSESNSMCYFLYTLEKKITNAKLSTKWYCLHSDNIFGPNIEDSSKINFTEMINSIRNSKQVKIESDFSNFSCLYIRDLLLCIYHCLKKECTSGIYNIASFNTSNVNIPVIIQKLKPNLNYKIELINNMNLEKNYSLEILKILSTDWKPTVLAPEAFYRTFCDKSDMDYEISRTIKKYHGRLNLIKQAELDMMKEIDRICKENNINYFLVGGSLLGAVRHKGFIPWDDDLDIGMLRKDYDKFRKICPQELSDKYSYQSYRIDPNVHYLFDKIRLKKSYFSTKFSNRFKIDNGIFVDILVYDKTSSIPIIQKIHIKLLKIFSRVLNIRWFNKPRKKVHYKASVIFLPFMRLIPYKFYHFMFEQTAKLFNHSKSNYYIDTVGQNLKKGAFHKDCIIGPLQYVPFENLTLPIPQGYDLYLKHWYGEDYMNIPSISARSSKHKIARMDLGDYVLKDTNKNT